MMISHPHPQSESLFLEKSPLFPQPLLPQKKSKRIIQIKELHPFPLLKIEDVLHPHPVAVKSLIVDCLQKFFVLWFIICVTACMCFCNLQKKFREIYCTKSPHMLTKVLHKFQDIVK